jgi:rubrerythrin
MDSKIKAVSHRSAAAKGDAMTLQEAITTALVYEVKVRDHYFKSSRILEDPKAKALFTLLAREEEGHVAYLDRCLEKWTREGQVAGGALTSLLPGGVAWIDEAKKKLSARPGKRVATGTELDAVKLALQLERQACDFYRTLVGTLPPNERELFAPFLDIEDGHVALVQAQLDSVQGLGFWFDTMEFNLEAG